MTDADGTEHVFTNVAGKWVAPPGLNMHLRRYRAGGSLLEPIPDKWAMTRPDGATHFFDNLGFLTSTKDRNGNTLSYDYERVNAFDGAACATGDIIGRLTAGPPPRLCTRRLTSVTDPAGRDLTIEYEEGGFLDTPLEGMLPQLPLDQAGVIGRNSRIHKITDHAGREYEFEYDDLGRLARFTEAANKADKRVTGFTYEAPFSRLRDVGDDRFLDEVQDIRDGDLHARTHLNYDDRQVLPPGGDRQQRAPYRISKRSDFPKLYTFDGDELEVKELLDDEVDRFATTTHEVDDDGRPVKVTDALGTVSALTWSDDNKVRRFTRAQGTDDESVADYTYDTTNGTGVLVSHTAYPDWPSTTGARTTDLVWAFGSGAYHADATEAASGQFVADLDAFDNAKPNTGWDFTFEPDTGNVTDREDAKGNVAHTDYDAFGRITLERDEEGNEVEYHDFHATGQPGRVVDERENPWFYKYDSVGNVTAVVDPRGEANPSGAEGNPFTTTLSYDSFDRLTREHIPKRSNIQNPVFITRTREFDRNGNVVESTDGRGQQTTIEHTPMDMPATVTEPGSNGAEISRYAYDAGDRLIGTIAPKGDGLTSVEQVVQTQASECANEDPPLDFLTRFCLDDIGRVLAEIRYSTRSGDPNSLITSFAYDRRDNVVGMVDPNRNAERTAGQAMGAALNPSLRRMEYAYNKVDEQTVDTEKPSEAGASPTVWKYFYDANGNQVEIRHPRGDHIRTHITYDHRDAVIAVEDPLGHLTCLQRRKDERVIAHTTPRGTAGNHANCTDGNSATGYTHFTTKYTYDPAGNLLSRSVPFAPDQYGRTDAQLADWKIEYTRDEVGDPATIKDARGHSFTNEFFDTGDMRTTNRPSFWRVSGGMVAEREGRSANAAKSDSAPARESTLGQTDFGRVDREPIPSLLPQAGHTEFSYDGEMNLTQVENAAGDLRTIDYDPAGRVSEREWPFKSGNPITHQFEYDKNGNLTSFTDGENAVTTYEYDGYDREIAETAPGAHAGDVDATALAEVTRFRYDHNGNQRFVETPRGVATTGTADDFTFETTYDSLDRVAFEQAPDGGRTSYAYDVASNVIAETRPRGQGRTGEDLESFQTRMAYDEADRMTESVDQVMDGTELVEHVTSMAYDADDNLTTLSEPGAKASPSAAEASQVTTRVFDGRGYPWKLTLGSGDDARTSIVEYDPNGNLRRLVKPRGVNQTTLNAESEDSGADSNQNLIDASENATVFRYNEDDLVVTERMPWNGGDQRKFRRRFLRTDNEANTVDALGRVLTIVSPHVVDDEGEAVADDVARTSYSYYDSDWVRSVSDQKLVNPATNAAVEHRHIFYDYDERGAQTKWESKNFGETAAGRHITRTFWPNGQMRTRAAEKTTVGGDPSKRMYEYLYNRNRSLAAMNDIRGAKDDADPDDDPDPNDRLTKIERDPVERQTEVNEVWAAGKDSRFEYDIAGNVLTRRTDGKIQTDGSFGGADRKTTTFEYDSLDREFRMIVDPMTGADRETITNYWPSGQRQSRRKPNGTSDRLFFNTLGEVTRRERQRDGQSGIEDDDINYRYDPNGNRDRDERGRYRFNARDQLTEWQKPGTADQNDPDVEDEDFNGRRTEYELNGDGAITKKTVHPPESELQIPVETTFEYLGERLKWAQTGGQRVYYRYDDFGNVTRIFTQAATDPEPDHRDPQDSACTEVPTGVTVAETYYCYDEFERLRLTRASGGDADPDVIEYDGLDRRDTRTIRRDGPDPIRDFSYVGTSELLSRDVDDDGTKRFYDYDSEGDRVGQQVTDGTDNRYRAYVKDALGSVVGLENDDGVVDDGTDNGRSTEYEYDPYGELENASSLEEDAENNPFRFEGFYYDSGVKTYDMLARPYRPDSGRFLTQDRYASASQDFLLQADPLTQNRYAFAGGNPINVAEFDGHDPPNGSYYNAPTDFYGKSSMKPGRRRNQQTSERRETSSASMGTPPDSLDRNYRGSTQRAIDRAWSSASGANDARIGGASGKASAAERRALAQAQHYATSTMKPLGNKYGCAAHPERYVCVGENVYRPGKVAVAIDNCLRGGFEGASGIDFGAAEGGAGSVCKTGATVVSAATVAKAGVTVTIKGGPKVLKRFSGMSQARRGQLIAADAVNAWRLAPTERGKVIEAILNKTEYAKWWNVGQELGGTFPLVDFQLGRRLVSLKTVDPSSKTAIGRMEAHIDDLATRHATVNGQPAQMGLDIRVPPGRTAELASLREYGRSRGVSVAVREFP